MCHSVEMYMPKLARAAAEHRLVATDPAVRRKSATADTVRGALARLRRWIARGPRTAAGRHVTARVR